MSLQSFAVVSLSVVTIFLIIYVAYLKFKHIYTREKYAFAALNASLSIALLTITAITTVPPWTGFAQLIATIIGKPLVDLPSPHWSEKVLVILFSGFVIGVIHRAFIMWNGAVSERQHSLSMMHDSTNVFVEGVIELRRILYRMPPPKV